MVHLVGKGQIMSLIKRIFRQQQEEQQERQSIPLAKYFHALEDSPNFPFNKALKDLENLERTAKKEDELFLYLLEDSIFASLDITFYEQILLTLKGNEELISAITDRFASNAEEREKVIVIQTQAHVQFVENKGLCPGCTACDNHIDVAELVQPWHRGDIDLLLTLYIGMQTIQHAMDQLLYDIVPISPSVIPLLTNKNLLEYRQYMFRYAEKVFAGDS
jgi:hypothetical protein